MVRDLESSATLVGPHALKLTVLFLETIRKPFELNRPGMFPASSQTKGATEAERRVTLYPVLSSCTSACRETHATIVTGEFEHESDAIRDFLRPQFSPSLISNMRLCPHYLALFSACISPVTHQKNAPKGYKILKILCVLMD